MTKFSGVLTLYVTQWNRSASFDSLDWSWLDFGISEWRNVAVRTASCCMILKGLEMKTDFISCRIS
jgi:hypothetical protein